MAGSSRERVDRYEERTQSEFSYLQLGYQQLAQDPLKTGMSGVVISITNSCKSHENKR